MHLQLADDIAQIPSRSAIACFIKIDDPDPVARVDQLFDMEIAVDGDMPRILSDQRPRYAVRNRSRLVS